MTYLELHPPVARQYRRPRRGTITGAICVHDAENVTDLTAPDTGAEAVARFIANRSDPGSYHTIVDSDSIIRLIPYNWEAFGEGTGGNPWALHLSLAYGSRHPPTPTWWQAAVTNAATEARAMSTYVKTLLGVGVPPRRITADQYRAGYPGFIAHADLDPGRRTDPVGFPWPEFLRLYAATPTPTPQPPKENPTMAVPQPTLSDVEMFVASAFYAAGNSDHKGAHYWVWEIANAPDWRVPAAVMRQQLGLK